AAAEISGEALPDLLVGRERMVAEHVLASHQHARRAEAALEAVMFAELSLKNVERFRRSQSLDRGDLGIVDLDGQREAGPHAAAVHQHRTRSADAVFAADVRSGQ